MGLQDLEISSVKSAVNYVERRIILPYMTNDIEYAGIADHFNSLQALYKRGQLSQLWSRDAWHEPKQADFSAEFMWITKIKQADDCGATQ